MAHCGSPGMCGKRPDCADTHCPGRNHEWAALKTHRVLGFVTDPPAGACSTCKTKCLTPESCGVALAEPEPGEGWPRPALWVAGIVAVAFFSAAVVTFY